MNILDGKKVSDDLLINIKEKIEVNNLNVGMGIILIGSDPASRIYVNNKIKKCEMVGIKPYLYELEETVTENEVIDLIQNINENNNIHGLIVQSPTPSHIDFKKCASKINYLKDIDGLGMENTYKNYLNENPVLPCTVKGIIELLNYYKLSISGKDVVIVGKGNLVGKPLTLAMLNLGATVTVCHSKTVDLKDKCSKADILISAAGVTHLIKKELVKENSVIIDVGISRVDGKLTGDVDYENVKNKVSYITPVPGGVGPMTVAMVVSNTLEAYERINNG